MATAYIGLGSNLGSREAWLLAARTLLDAAPEVEVVAHSRLYHSAPIGPPQPHYLNAALAIRTERAPAALLSLLQEIETQLGRVREVRWGARNIDLDLLLYGDAALRTDTLVLPHPRISERTFVLAPLLDLTERAELRGALEALGGPPPVRPWSEVQRTDELVTVRALDDADAFALAVSSLADPTSPSGDRLVVQPVKANDLEDFAATVGERGGGLVVLEASSPPIHGLRIGARNAPPSPALTSIEVDDGVATLRIGGGPRAQPE